MESDSIVYERLRKLFTTNGWVEEEELVNTLQMPLMRLCAHYLYTEKLRGYALDSVGKNISSVLHMNSVPLLITKYCRLKTLVKEECIGG